MTDEERREAGRLAQRRYRARRDGKPITRDMYPVHPSWPSIAEARRRLDALFARRDDAAHRRIHEGPLREFWSIGPVPYVPVIGDPRYTRDTGADPIVGQGIAGWAQVHGHQTRAVTDLRGGVSL